METRTYAHELYELKRTWCTMSNPNSVDFSEIDMPPEILVKINQLLEEHGLKVENKYTGSLCGLEGTYTCWIEEI